MQRYSYGHSHNAAFSAAHLCHFRLRFCHSKEPAVDEESYY